MLAEEHFRARSWDRFPSDRIHQCAQQRPFNIIFFGLIVYFFPIAPLSAYFGSSIQKFMTASMAEVQLGLQIALAVATLCLAGGGFWYALETRWLRQQNDHLLEHNKQQIGYLKRQLDIAQRNNTPFFLVTMNTKDWFDNATEAQSKDPTFVLAKRVLTCHEGGFKAFVFVDKQNPPIALYVDAILYFEDDNGYYSSATKLEILSSSERDGLVISDSRKSRDEAKAELMKSRDVDEAVVERILAPSRSAIILIYEDIFGQRLAYVRGFKVDGQIVSYFGSTLYHLN